MFGAVRYLNLLHAENFEQTCGHILFIILDTCIYVMQIMEILLLWRQKKKKKKKLNTKIKNSLS